MTTLMMTDQHKKRRQRKKILDKHFYSSSTWALSESYVMDIPFLTTSLFSRNIRFG